MSTENKDFCVILAGGKGRRLWPVSREEYPKQFIDFFGTGRTQLQQTYDRFTRIIPRENIYVNTNQDYAHLVREQLPELAPDHLMAEPIHRNTAPSVAWACHRVLRVCPDANLIVSPSDMDVHDEEAFQENIREGLEFVSHNDGLLTMGVKPTRPEPGYGYIQLGEPIGDHLFQVKSFTEKPDREFAKMFIASGEFCWNTGLFLSRASFLQKSFMELLPSVFRRLDTMNPNFTVEEEDEFVRQNFPLYPNLSIDHSILERSEQVYVMMCDFGWADVGTWHSIYEAMQKSDDDNVVITSDVILEDSRNNIIKLPEGRLAVINGLDGYIVAEKDNVLLICKKEDSSALVRKYVNEVQLKKGEKYI
ncbi:MAG: mannose-1-phosphate guanylyltransferase [Prevotella sp.]|nr:mannose-1-phosphate guanylyltransferase [Prevotella sp.]